MKRIFRCFLFPILFASQTATAGELPRQLTDTLDRMIETALADRAFPGAALAVGDRNGLLYARTYGFQDYRSGTEVGEEDLYDLASCTKVLSTTFVIMHLYDRGVVTLDETVAQSLPEFASSPVGTITVRELLTHTSGLKPQSFYRHLIRNAQDSRLFSARKSEAYPYALAKNCFIAKDIVYDTAYIARSPREGYRQMGDSLYIAPSFDTVIHNHIVRIYAPASRGKYLYDDTNFYLLKRIAEQKTGQSLERLTEALFDRLQCRHTGYNPLQWYDARHIVPTERDVILRRGIVRGYAHDELAAIQGGVGGNAGLFSTARDVAVFCEMILNGGNHRGEQIIESSTVDLFTSSPLAERSVFRGLGFDKRNGESDLGGAQCCGHTGYTGTFFWLDRQKGCYLVFLCNRVHPTRMNNKLSQTELRTKLWLKVSEYFETSDCK